MKKRILLLTGQYPYGNGEPYLSAEIKAWRANGASVIILPFSRTRGINRCSHSGVSVFKHSIAPGIISVLKTGLRYKFIYHLVREIFHIIKKYKFKGILLIPYSLKEWALICTAGTMLREFNKSIKCSQFELVYSYWNSNFAVAAEILKSELGFRKLITRAHGFDLYEERRPKQYYPFKRQFSRSFDVVVFLTESAKEYYSKRYARDSPTDFISRLGVCLDAFGKYPDVMRCASFGEVLRLVTVSNIVNVKRLDRVVDVIVSVASHPMFEGKRVEWDHYGDGKEKESLVSYWNYRLADFDNAELSLKGHVENSVLVHALRESDYHFFLNFSESEGVPVSIMEAMLSEIFVIATDVGSTSDLVEDRVTGVLVKSFDPQEIARFIIDYLGQDKREQVVKNAKEHVCLYFDAAKNHDEFVRRVLSI